jgi:hypothetical protein
MSTTHNKLIYLVCLISLSILTDNVSAELIGHWKLDEGSGTVAKDSVGSNDGILIGDTRWTTGHLRGALEFDGDGDYVDCGHDSSLDPTGSFSIMFWTYIRDWSVAWAECIIGKGGDGDRGGWAVRRYSNQAILFTVAGLSGSVGSGNNLPGNEAPPLDEWVHIACVYDENNSLVNIYFNGVLDSSITSIEGEIVPAENNAHLYLGTRGNTAGTGPDGWSDAFFDGMLDDVRFYSHALSQSEIAKVMLGDPPGQATNPKPKNGITDILRDNVNLSWSPGELADKHNVYFGTNIEDVNLADAESPLLVSPVQDANSYHAGRLELGQTYFWRIDEIEADGSTIHKGNIWSFTVEPYAIPILGENITATASSYTEGQGPEKTIDGSGLDNDQHSISLPDMWLTSESDSGPAWIQYDFGKAHKLHEMLVWNYNGAGINTIYGFKDVIIEHSFDANTWTPLDDVSEFPKAPGTENYAPIIVNFNNVITRYVKITANSNWIGGQFNQYGLSEVRITAVPVSTREPNPETGTTDVAIDVNLSWRAGREAAEHNVFLSTDEQSVIDGTTPFNTVFQAGYSPPLLDLGTTFFWRVDEVNNNETTTTWQGDVWSFTTSEYIVVDDFESYNDITAGQEGSNLVYNTWTDGYLNQSTNGSTIGFISGASMETNIVHGGEQSVPLGYDNTTAGFSEVTVDPVDLPIGRDWTVSSPETLVLWIYGEPNNPVTDQMYIKVNNAKVLFEGNLMLPDWQEFLIDLASLGIDLRNVTTLTIGFERIGATGSMGRIFIDDIRLYRYISTPEPVEESIVKNSSFENDGEFTGVPSGWTGNNTGGIGTSFGSVSTTDGDYYLWQGNGSLIYQTTGEVIAAEGITYLLQVDARNSWMGSPKIILYYYNAGQRIELGSSSLPANGDTWATPATLEVTAITTAASVGKNLGVELTIANYPGDVWIHYDNVRLSQID